MEFVFTCRKHGTELQGQPLIGQDANGSWVLEQSDMWCAGNPEPGDNPEGSMCNEDWKTTVTF